MKHTCYALALTLAFGSLGCGDGDSGSPNIDVEGTVAGQSLEVRDAVIILRTEEGFNGETTERLDIYAYNDGILLFCPDVATPADVGDLGIDIRLEAPQITEGRYEIGSDELEAAWVCDDESICDLFGIDATSGTLEIESVSPSVVGTFTFDFEGEVVTGSLDVQISCME
ncbi:MAG: hypothetical protein AAGA54_36160 [Myxococcota bacterium]